MNSQKFMFIALILLAMVPGANPDAIFTGAATLGISQLYPGLQEAFRNYATQIASNQAAEGQELEVEVAAYNALSQPGAIVSYFQGLDENLRQEIFAGTVPTSEEISTVWEIINTWVANIYGVGQTLHGLVSNNPAQVLKSLSEFAMIASCLRITYSAIRFTCNVVRGACNIASQCGRVTIGALKRLNKLRNSQSEIVVPLAAPAAAGDDLLTLIAAMPVSTDDMPIDEVLKLEGTMSDVNYINLINALKANGFNVDNYSTNISRTASLPGYLPSGARPFDQMHPPLAQRSLSEPNDAFTPFVPPVDSNKNIGVKRKDREDRGGRTKKHLKKKQRKSIRKQRKTKRGKRAPLRQSRRYKK